MNEHLIVKSFGPVKDIDITFKKVTVFIGDQGTGKSCVAKLFSMFIWLEKDLLMGRHNTNYYETGDKFRNILCKYHRIETFVRNESYVKFEGNSYKFEYLSNKFHITDISQKGEMTSQSKGLPKIMYVPAERSVLSVAENKSKLIKELPESCSAFNDEFSDAKEYYKKEYNLPFGGLHYKYDTLNNVSRIWGDDYSDNPVLLRNASSGIQSALPMCLVSYYLSEKISAGEEVKLSDEERKSIENAVKEIMNNETYSKSVKDSMLKHLSTKSKYGSFVNIVEEPELNLFPQSQKDVLFSLIRNNSSTDDNMLVMTTHSPYTLAILNLMIMAGEVVKRNKEIDISDIVPIGCIIDANDIAIYRLSEKNETYCKSEISEETKLISKNELDSVSDDIMQGFNILYRYYVNSYK